MLAGRLGLFAVLFATMPALSAAQEGRSFAAVQQQLKLNQQVLVTEIGGGTTRGDVVALSPNSITLRFHDAGIERRRTFGPQTIISIRRSDRLWNGLLVGIAAGIAASEIWHYRVCGRRGYDSECSAIIIPAGWTIFVPSGAVVGALVDKAIGNNLIYAAGRQATFAVQPRVSPGAAQLTASLRF
jgi:hypothetical protein